MTITDALVVASGDRSLPALLTRPDGRARAGIVTLHPASGPQRDYMLFRHLAGLVSPLGIAVLSYDRRAADGDDDVPFELQARDAEAAVATLTEHLGREVPIGLWAFSQRAWWRPSSRRAPHGSRS